MSPLTARELRGIRFGKGLTEAQGVDADPVSYWNSGAAVDVLDGEYLVVTGSKGVGKSRLLLDLQQQELARGATVVTIANSVEFSDPIVLEALAGLEGAAAQAVWEMLILGWCVRDLNITVPKKLQADGARFASPVGRRRNSLASLVKALRVEMQFDDQGQPVFGLGAGDLSNDDPSEDVLSGLIAYCAELRRLLCDSGRLVVLLDRLDALGSDLLISVLPGALRAIIGLHQAGVVSTYVPVRSEVLYACRRQGWPEASHVLPYLYPLDWTPSEVEAVCEIRLGDSSDAFRELCLGGVSVASIADQHLGNGSLGVNPRDALQVLSHVQRLTLSAHRATGRSADEALTLPRSGVLTAALRAFASEKYETAFVAENPKVAGLFEDVLARFPTLPQGELAHEAVSALREVDENLVQTLCELGVLQISEMMVSVTPVFRPHLCAR
ncbi:hypothetical protein [Cellulomonas sp. Y8]|uniref:hypothetical protein n=1 Tax=Cellulomonas sp. Y8 TaxID=2591145 RepID=UPI0011C94B4F|nr:hypothetical protein [Cellulomonas sp. Y8]